MIDTSKSTLSAPVVAPPSHNAKRFFIILGIVLLILIPGIVFAGTYYLMNLEKSSQGTPSIFVTPTPIAESTLIFTPQETIAPQLLTAKQPSKLGIFILTSYTEGAKKIVAAGPKVIKVMDPHSSPEMNNAVKDYKQSRPDGIVVVRMYGRQPAFTLKQDPIQSAEEYFETRLMQPLNILKNAKSLYDYIEAPNEVENTPGWETVEEVTWLGKFWARLTELNAEAGFKTCIGSIPVGNPGGDPAQMKAKLQAFAPALDAALKSGGTICYHGYSIEYSTDVAIENWFSLRHRIFQQAMREINPEYAQIPFIISEGGIDKTGNPETDGWKARGTEQQFIDWLQWYDKELQKDPQVIGVTLFQIGDSHWSSFDVEAAADEIVDMIEE